jgi:hypothetical protein
MHSENKNRRPKPRLPFSAVLSYLVLLAAAVSGVTFSKYMAGTTVGDTARVAIMRDITVTETGNFAEPDKWVITTGVDMIKNAVVNFEGSEMACFVFCEIKTTGWSRLDEHSFAFSGGSENILGWAVNNGWNYLSGNGSEAVYYRTVSANAVLQADVLAEGGKITVSENITKTQLDSLPKDMQIKISATAVQYNGFSEETGAEYTEAQKALAAWNAVKNK